MLILDSMEVEISPTHGDYVSDVIAAPRTYRRKCVHHRSYGICVKLLPPQRRSSTHPLTGFTPIGMENGSIKSDNAAINANSTLKPIHDTGGDRNQSNHPEQKGCDISCDLVTSSSDTDSVDLYDQLVEHFTKKNSKDKEVPAPRSRRPTVTAAHPIRRRNTVNCARISTRDNQSYRRTCSWATSTVVKRQSSVSTASSQDSRPPSDQTFSQFHSQSSSTAELDKQRLTALYCAISSDSLETRKSNSRASTDYSNTDDSVSILSSKSTSLLLLEYKSQLDQSTIDMLRSQVRRSMTPDLAIQNRGRNGHNDYINSLLSPASSLDKVTADSIDRGRIRRNDKFSETMESIGQLSGSTTSLPSRSKSAMGYYPRDPNDQWSANFNTDKRSKTLSPSYSSKSSSHISPTGQYSVTNYSFHNGRTWNKSHSTDSASQYSEARTTPSLHVRDEFGYEVHARPNSRLDIALSEDHDSIMRLLKMPEDDFTTKLISTMRELKDIAEVARIIDEVDNEEWLLIFIGELDHRLRYLMKLEEEDDEPQDHEANLREKATILDVALDLISFLKERSAYRSHRGRSKLGMDEYFPSSESASGADDGSTTIKRMRKLADAAPQNPYDMQKWQRQLINLAGTLDKYITVLQKEKSSSSPKTRNFNSSPKAYQKPTHWPSNSLHSDATSQDSDSSARNFNFPKDSTTGESTTFRSPDKKEGRGFGMIKTDYNHNSNNNNSNNNVPHAAMTSQPTKTLPVLDLRDTQGGSKILSHISQAAHVREPASPQKSPSRSLKSLSPSKTQQIEPNISPNRGNKNAKYDKNRPSSATNRKPNNDRAAYQAKSVDDLKKTFERGMSSDDNVPHSRRFDLKPESRSTVTKNPRDITKRSAPTRSKSLREVKPKRKEPSEDASNNSFDREENPLSCRSWLAGDRTDANRLSHEPSDNQLKANSVVSAYCILPDKPRKRSSSMTSDLEARREYRRQKSEFNMSVRDDERDTSSPSMRRSINSPDSSKSTTPRRKEVTSSGARPKIRSSSTVPATRRPTYDSSSSSDFERPRYPRVVTSSTTTQCDFDQGLRQREKSTEDMLKQMKRKAELLKTGLEEARRERDEKDRKIAVLQARLERTKKNLVVGESEKGAVEEEMDRLNKLLKEKTVESEEEISALKRRLQELEKKIEKEKRKYNNMNDTIENLQSAMRSAERRVERMERNKQDLEQQIEELTTALVQERQNNAHLQQENARLEQELEAKDKALIEARDSRNEAGNELQRHNHALAQELDRAKVFANSISDEKDKIQDKVCEMQNELKKAEEKIAELESQKDGEAGKNAELEQQLTEVREHAGALAREKSDLEDTIKELENRLESTGGIIEALEGEKRELQAKNQELAEALSHEQMMSKDLAECYMEQVDYLNKELKLNEDMKKAQQDQYDKEISRLLAESSLSSQQAEELEKAKEDAKREKSRADELEKENEELRQQQETLVTASVQDSSDGVNTEDKSVQADDMSYTRMRAFDWYSSQSRQDAMRLTEQGRQLELETRRRIARARDAMRAVNESIVKEKQVVKMYTLRGAK